MDAPQAFSLFPVFLFLLCDDCDLSVLPLCHFLTLFHLSQQIAALVRVFASECIMHVA